MSTPESMETYSKAGTLIVFGYGPVEAHKAFNLNLYGRLNALAAGILYQHGKIGRIVVTGGHTGGADLPTEAECAKRFLVRHFDIPEEIILLENQATDTITNFVYVANILDHLSLPADLTFLAFGFHLPRIQYLADLFGLSGESVAAEEVVWGRSRRHRRLLHNLLNSEDESFRKLLIDQVRSLRSLETMPEYWLPPTEQLCSEKRLRSIMRLEQVQAFLRAKGLEPRTPTDFRTTLSSLSRRFPEPEPKDREKALREYQEVSFA